MESNGKSTRKSGNANESAETIKFSAFENELEAAGGESVPTVPYPKIKSSLGMLERFLKKNFALLLGVYVIISSVCAGGLILNNMFTTANASNGVSGTTGSATNSLDTWLYSILAISTLAMVMTIVYLVTKHIRRKKTEAK